MGAVDVTDEDTHPKATRIVWGTTAGFLIVSIVLVSVLVRWRFRRNYHLVSEDAFVEESLPGNFSTIYAISIDSLAATFASEPQRLSSSFSEIPDHLDDTSSFGRRHNPSMSWKSESASSYSTRIMSGVWKTSLQPAFLSKPIYHTLQLPKSEAALAEDMNQMSISENFSSNIRYPVPSSPLSEAFHQYNFERPSPESLAGAEQVAFYSAAKQQLLDPDRVATRVLPLRPLPLPPQPRPLPIPPQTKGLG